MKKIKSLGFFIALFFVSLFIILFVSKEKNDEGVYKFNLTLDGYKAFKKGLDVAGGVRLTYKIDFSKQKQVYTDINQLNSVKTEIEDIIMKNIDTRISTLGVSDYNSYIQTLNEDDYLIVELGGFSDIDEAKSIIGKTVELEFKLENKDLDNQKMLAQRYEQAQELLVQVATNPEGMQNLSFGKESIDIYYNNYQGYKISDLPAVYSNKINELAVLNEGEIYPTILSGNLIESGVYGTEVKGWFISRFNGMTETNSTNTDLASLNLLAEKYGIELTAVYEKNYSGELGSNEFSISADDSKLMYNEGAEFAGQKAFDVIIYDVTDYEAIDVAKESLAQNKHIEGLEPVFSEWISETTIKSLISDYNFVGEGNVSAYEQDEHKYVVYNIASKGNFENLTKLYVADLGDNTKAFSNEISVQRVYSIEEIFVKNQPTWIAAKTDDITNEDGTVEYGQVLDAKFFKYATVGQSATGMPAPTVTFTEEGGKIFCDITAKNIGNPMAIFVGGQLVTAPNIQDKICNNTAIITGKYDNNEVKEMVDNLNEGALPAPLILSHEEKVSPTLGQQALSGAMIAGVIGFGAIFLFMFFMYGFAKATVAALGLIIYLTILFGIVKVLGYALSLSGIAAIILNIGMAVDANVLIFERVKEELKKGRSAKQAINTGYDKSLSAIKDGNFTTGVIGVLLFLVGTNVFKGFGTMLIVNIALTLLVIVPVTKQLLLVLLKDSKKQ